MVVEGQGADSQWREYEFRGKPTDLKRRPPQWAPYHLRLDWMMWFLPFSVPSARGRAAPFGYETWFVRLMEKLLEADLATLRLLRVDPLDGRRPTFVRARFYRYEYTTRAERRQTGAWWKRREIGEYLPAVSRADLEEVLA